MLDFSVKRVTLLGVGLLVVALLMQAPARLLGFVLTPQGIIASGYSGSIWDGGVDSLLVPVAGQYVQLGKTHWQLSPWSLLILTARTDVHMQWGGQTLNAELQLSPWSDPILNQLELTANARLLRLFLPVELRGTAQLLASGVELSGQQITAGSGRLVWKRARWIGSNSRQQLGDYVLEFNVTGSNQVDAKVSSLSGPIRVDGSVGLNGSEYSVDLKLRTDLELSTEFRSALELMAAPTGDGYHIKFTTTL